MAEVEDGVAGARQQLSERGGAGQHGEKESSSMVEDFQCASLAFKELFPYPHHVSSKPQLEREEEERPSARCSSCSIPHITCWPLMAAIILCLLFVVVGRTYLEQLLDWLEELSLLSSLLVFTALFTLVSFPFGCGYIIINMAAGYIHGVVEGQMLVVVTVALGFSIAFLLCRSCLRVYAQSQLSSHLLALVRVVEGPHGFRVILLTRLTPIPFGMQNTLFAMTNVSYTRVLCASVLGLLPTQILNTYVGSTLRSIREVLTDRADAYIILSFQIIVSVLLTLYLVRKARLELTRMNSLVDIEKGEENGPL